MVTGGDFADQQHLSHDQSTNLTGSNDNLPKSMDLSCVYQSSFGVHNSSRLDSDRMAIILSSLSETAWLSSTEFVACPGEFETRLPIRNNLESLGTNSLQMIGGEEILEPSVGTLCVASEREMAAACVPGLSTNAIGEAGAIDVSVKEVARPSVKWAEEVSSCVVSKISDVVEATEIIDEVHRRLVLGCRAHRASVLRMAAMTKVLAPESVRRLCQSGCALLIRIGSINDDSKVGPTEESGEHQPLSQSLPHSQLSQLPIAGQTEYSLDVIVKQTHALMALSLHCAPDEVIAAVNDMLLTKINTQDNQSVWQEEDRIQPATAALFLSGVLLLRIRALSVHASRILMRAVEVSVKRAPAMAIGFLLPSMVALRYGSHAKLCLQSNLFQHEMFQRATRQGLSEAQRDDLLYQVSISSTVSITSPDDLLSPAMRATCRVVDALLCSSLSDDSCAIASAGGGQTNKKKQGQGSSSSIALELSAMAQDACLLKWTNSVASSSMSASEDRDLGSVWCAQIGLKLKNTPALDLESDLLVNINAILGNVRVLFSNCSCVFRI